MTSVAIVLSVTLLANQTVSQTTLPNPTKPAISRDDLQDLRSRIHDLKNPMFRAFLRARLLPWILEANTARREAALLIATEGLMDLCSNQQELWPATAVWINETFVSHIKRLQEPQSQNEVALCVLNVDKRNSPTRDFNAAVKMLASPDTAGEGMRLAKNAILTGQVPVQTLQGSLQMLKAARSSSLNELLSTLLLNEEEHPGSIPLQMMTFFFTLFMGDSIPPELLKRYLFVAVRATRVNPTELTKPTISGPVVQILSNVRPQAELHAPELYPEIVSRLNSLTDASAANKDRQAAIDRIRQANDPLEQTITEANETLDESFRRSLFFRAALLAKGKDEFRKAADLALKSESQPPSRQLTINQLLVDLVKQAITRKAADDAFYVISKIQRPIDKATGLRLLGAYFAETGDKVARDRAFFESVKLMKQAEPNVDTVSAWFLLIEQFQTHKSEDAVEVLREAIKTLNNLPSPEKDKEQAYFLRLMPVADGLIRIYRTLATQDKQTAVSLSTEIKMEELRLAALGGAYTGMKDSAKTFQKSNQ